MGVAAKSNRVKESPKAAIHTAAIIAETLARLLQASANAGIQVANRNSADGGSLAAIRPFCEISSHAGSFNTGGSRTVTKKLFNRGS